MYKKINVFFTTITFFTHFYLYNMLFLLKCIFYNKNPHNLLFLEQLSVLIVLFLPFPIHHFSP